MDRLSTGKRISSAKDDVGGFVMATTFEKDIRAAAQGAENTKHAIALLETVSSAANQAINILTRMKELAVQASTDGYTTGQRNNMNNEFQGLVAELTRIDTQTIWNGTAWMDTVNTMNINFGDTNTMSVNFSQWTPGDATTAATQAYGAAVFGGNAANDDLTTTARSIAMVSEIDVALTAASAEAGKYGAYINRLNRSLDSLKSRELYLTNTLSKIEDADYGVETAELARTQIVAQAATAMLTQANQNKQTVMALLQ
jgi:flagellin